MRRMGQWFGDDAAEVYVCSTCIMLRRVAWWLVTAAFALAVSACAPEPIPSYWISLSEKRERQQLQHASDDVGTYAPRQRNEKRARARPQAEKKVAKRSRPVKVAQYKPSVTPPAAAPQAKDVSPKVQVTNVPAEEQVTSAETNESERGAQSAAPAIASGSKQASDGFVRARAKFSQGEVLEARRIIHTLFRVESVEPIETLVLELGRTYDPAYLGQLAAADVTPDVERARRYYEDARLLGSVEAANDLQRLLAHVASNRPSPSGTATEKGTGLDAEQSPSADPLPSGSR